MLGNHPLAAVPVKRCQGPNRSPWPRAASPGAFTWPCAHRPGLHRRQPAGCPAVSSGSWGLASLCTRPRQSCPSEICAQLRGARPPSGPGRPHLPQLCKAKGRFGGAAGGSLLALGQACWRWKAEGERLHPKQHRSSSCPKVCALCCVFLKHGAVKTLLRGLY